MCVPDIIGAILELVVYWLLVLLLPQIRRWEHASCLGSYFLVKLSQTQLPVAPLPEYLRYSNHSFSFNQSSYIILSTSHSIISILCSSRDRQDDLSDTNILSSLAQYQKRRLHKYQWQFRHHSPSRYCHRTNVGRLATGRTSWGMSAASYDSSDEDSLAPRKAS